MYIDYISLIQHVTLAESLKNYEDKKAGSVQPDFS